MLVKVQKFSIVVSGRLNLVCSIAAVAGECVAAAVTIVWLVLGLVPGTIGAVGVWSKNKEVKLFVFFNIYKSSFVVICSLKQGNWTPEYTKLKARIDL